MPDIKITDEIRGIINRCRFDGNKVYLPEGQLDRKLYVKINALLEECGGSWNRKEKAHVFPSDPREKLGVLVSQEKLIDSQKAFQKYYTPQWLVEKLVTLADVKGKTVLEPSCGDGRVIRECLKQGAVDVTGIDVEPENCDGLTVIKDDFLKIQPDSLVDVVAGNPPFAKLGYLKHTLHAYNFLKPGGKLVFILPNSIHSNKKFQDFVVDKRWEFDEVEAGAFSDEGTEIATNIVTIYK